MISTTLAHMKLLVSLSKADGLIAPREKNYIVNIGHANGVSAEEVLQLFDQQYEVIVPKGLSRDQKFDYIYSLVQLMKIDERMYKEEIVFCCDIATRLGYDKQVMAELILHVKASGMDPKEVASLKNLTDKFLTN